MLLFFFVVFNIFRCIIRQGRQAKIVDDRHIVDDVHFPGGDPPRREEQAMGNYW
jgi:hypothetical protein